VDPQFAVILDETQFPEFVHEEAHARAGRPDHVGKGLLTDLCRDHLRPAFLSEVEHDGALRVLHVHVQAHTWPALQQDARQRRLALPRSAPCGGPRRSAPADRRRRGTPAARSGGGEATG
jgi:hypothetical protein